MPDIVPEDDPIDGVLYNPPVTVTNVAVLDNPAPFLHPFQFSIAFECYATVQHDLEWRVIYVGFPENDGADQCLENVVFEGPIPVGIYKFILEAKAPDPNLIPEVDKIGSSAIILQCSYQRQIFYHRGYFLNNEYDDEKLIKDPPVTVKVDQLRRDILTDLAVVIYAPIKLNGID
ncbi:histone chaperone ASF1B-like [Impatiens glandulifera]|uniref:histone chaperone ASF1B-like n=1 Tax=Impatiens glandulifera TaxID=253017 RepID=UPI001FB0D0A2|nr:histone chaperone ASF1B-like [Impatiens glandulifera]